MQIGNTRMRRMSGRMRDLHIRAIVVNSAARGAEKTGMSIWLDAALVRHKRFRSRVTRRNINLSRILRNSALSFSSPTISLEFYAEMSGPLVYHEECKHGINARN